MRTLNVQRLKVLFASFAAVAMLSHCKGSEVLSPEPSALDLDRFPPTCPGIQTLDVTAGPSLTVTWSPGTDDVSDASKISYYVYARNISSSYDLVSPAKIVNGATTTILTNGIAVGQTYTLFVSCRDEAGNNYPTGPLREKSIRVDDILAPTSITDLSAGNVTTTSILLRWSPSDDGAGGTTASQMQYRVYASLTSPVNTSGSPLTTQTANTSFLHAGLNPNERWYYRVVAADLTGNKSSDSNQATNITIDDTIAPVFPGNNATITMTSNTTTQINLSWATATDDVTASSAIRYSIYRCNTSTSCDPFLLAPIATTAAGATTYSDSGLADSTTYVYGVRARDFRNNLSINTDKTILSTLFSATGAFFAYPTLTEVGQQFGGSVVVANVIGAKTGMLAFPDLVVGAPVGSEPNGRYRNTGCVYIFAGTGIGQFSLTASKSICSPTPSADNGAFGTAIVAADFDGNGTTDLFITAPGRQAGWFYLVQDDGTGELAIDIAGAQQLTGTSTSWGTGACAAEMKGVVNGGADLIVTAPAETCVGGCGGFTTTGSIYVYKNTSIAGAWSPPAAPNLSSNVTAEFRTGTGGLTTISNGEQVARRCTIGKFDSRVAQRNDFIVVFGSGASNAGASATTDGALGFFKVNYATNFTLTVRNIVNLSTTTVPAGSQWADSVRAIQINSNTPTYSAPGLAVGTPNDSTGGASNGTVYLYDVVTDGAGLFSLVDNGLAFYGGSEDQNNNGVGQVVYSYNFFGHTDGTEDLIYGAPLEDRVRVAGSTALNVGDVYIHKNLGGGIVTSAISQSLFDFSAFNARTDQLYGFGMCNGDINGDGIADVAVGAPLQDYDIRTQTTNGNVGALYIYYGKSTGEIDFSAPSQILYGPGDSQNGYFGSSCVVMDYNGDNMNDLVVGSYNRTVTTAGRGAVYVYYGRGASLSLGTAPSTTITAPTAASGGINFGFAMTKGDFDGNGKEDLAVSAINVTYGGFTGAGQVYVYWADSTGQIQVSNAPTTISPPSGVSGSANNPYLFNPIVLKNTINFGYSLAAFPTRPRSGSSPFRLGTDLIICAPNLDVLAGETNAGSTATTSQGACFVYEGSVNIASGGAPTNYQISAFPQNQLRHTDGSSYNDSRTFGSSMTIGKWSSDAAEDLVVCAQQARQGGTANVGACYAYYGRWDSVNNRVDGGFSVTSSWNVNMSGTRQTPLFQAKIYNPFPELTVAIGFFGKSVNLLDVNNNGSADLLVGEPYSDHSTSVPGGGVAPTNLGKDSGRVYIIRGGY